MAKWHSSHFGMGVFIRMAMTMMEMMILHTSMCVFAYLPICSIDTSQKPMVISAEWGSEREGTKEDDTKNNGAKVKLVG